MKIDASKFTKLDNNINTIVIYGNDESYIEYLKTEIITNYHITNEINDLYTPNLFNYKQCYIGNIHSVIQYDKILTQNIAIIIEYGNIAIKIRDQLLTHKNILLISCFGNSNISYILKKHLKPNIHITSDAIKYLSYTFNGHHGLLIQELRKIQNYTNKISIESINNCMYLPNNAQYHLIVKYLLLNQKNEFWEQLNNMYNTNINDIIIIKYISSFIVDLLIYKQTTTKPKIKIFFLYEHIFYQLAQQFSSTQLQNILITTLHKEVNIKNNQESVEDLINYIHQDCNY